MNSKTLRYRCSQQLLAGTVSLLEEHHWFSVRRTQRPARVPPKTDVLNVT